MDQIKVYSPFFGEMPREVPLDFSKDEVITQQQFKEECDIGQIIAKAERGIMPERSGADLQFGDFSGISTFHEAEEAVARAKEAFMTLPAQVRKSFNHDPQELMVFLADQQNFDKAAEMGLISQEAIERVSKQRADARAAEIAAEAAKIAGGFPAQQKILKLSDGSPVGSGNS